MQPPQQPPNITVHIPEDRAAGDYADGIGCSASPHVLMLDFYVALPGPTPTVQLSRRVKLPIAMARELLEHINQAMDGYENQYGPIHRPGEAGGTETP